MLIVFSQVDRTNLFNAVIDSGLTTAGVGSIHVMIVRDSPPPLISLLVRARIMLGVIAAAGWSAQNNTDTFKPPDDGAHENRKPGPFPAPAPRDLHLTHDTTCTCTCHLPPATCTTSTTCHLHHLRLHHVPPAPPPPPPPPPPRATCTTSTSPPPLAPRTSDEARAARDARASEKQKTRSVPAPGSC